MFLKSTSGRTTVKAPAPALEEAESEGESEGAEETNHRRGEEDVERKEENEEADEDLEEELEEKADEEQGNAEEEGQEVDRRPVDLHTLEEDFPSIPRMARLVLYDFLKQHLITNQPPLHSPQAPPANQSVPLFISPAQLPVPPPVTPSSAQTPNLPAQPPAPVPSRFYPPSHPVPTYSLPRTSAIVNPIFEPPRPREYQDNFDTVPLRALTQNQFTYHQMLGNFINHAREYNERQVVQNRSLELLHAERRMLIQNLRLAADFNEVAQLVPRTDGVLDYSFSETLRRLEDDNPPMAVNGEYCFLLRGLLSAPNIPVDVNWRYDLPDKPLYCGTGAGYSARMDDKDLFEEYREHMAQVREKGKQDFDTEFIEERRLANEKRSAQEFLASVQR